MIISKIENKWHSYTGKFPNKLITCRKCGFIYRLLDMHCANYLMKPKMLFWCEKGKFETVRVMFLLALWQNNVNFIVEWVSYGEIIEITTLIWALQSLCPRFVIVYGVVVSCNKLIKITRRTGTNGKLMPTHHGIELL